jgi:hypothetical protein
MTRHRAAAVHFRTRAKIPRAEQGAFANLTLRGA